MREVLSAAAAVAALAIAAPSFAQQSTTTDAATPPTSGSTGAGADASTDVGAGVGAGASTDAGASTSTGPSTGAAPSAGQAGADASVTTGMTVKDKTGATIGQVSDVNTEGGKTMATIKMGAETFAVDAANLGVAGGSAMINASQAEIQQMLKK